MKKITILIICLLVWSTSQAQVTQTIRGKIIDSDIKTPLPGATVMIIGNDSLNGTVSDMDGFFRLDHVPVGRINLQISYMGYETKNLPNILVRSGKETVMNVELTESIQNVDEVKISAKKNKAEVLNEMSVVSARAFSVEETKRYAGAMIPQEWFLLLLE